MSACTAPLRGGTCKLRPFMPLEAHGVATPGDAARGVASRVAKHVSASRRQDTSPPGEPLLATCTWAPGWLAQATLQPQDSAAQYIPVLRIKGRSRPVRRVCEGTLGATYQWYTTRTAAHPHARTHANTRSAPRPGMVHRLPRLLKAAEAQGTKYDWCVIMAGINDLGGCRTGPCAARGLVLRFGRALAASHCGWHGQHVGDAWCAVQRVAGSVGVLGHLQVKPNGPACQTTLAPSPRAASACVTFSDRCFAEVLSCNGAPLAERRCPRRPARSPLGRNRYPARALTHAPSHVAVASPGWRSPPDHVFNGLLMLYRACGEHGAKVLYGTHCRVARCRAQGPAPRV